MKLYNTLTKNVDDFQPLEGDTVRLYTCGPTVYDHAHIGNLSAFIAADTLKRTLKSAGFKVKHVMNLTDVDDKTIRRSQEKYPNLEPKEALTKLTREYEELFKQDMVAIGNQIDDIEFVRATDAIIEMQVLISKLVDEGFAYIAEDGIYFSIEAYTKSGKKYGQLTSVDSSNTSKARIANDEYDKDSAHDFALWKFKKDNEPAWDFQINDKNHPGRPGWHIECSAMSTMKLGQPFDIHTGGIDLIFPHHENEIAQSTAGHEESVFANFFVHSEHVLVNGKKMAKSANNFYTLEDIKKKGFDPLAFRLLVLQSHYRNQTNFSWENLQAAQNRLLELYNWADLRYQPSTDTMTSELDNEFQSAKNNTLRSIHNDINTPEALSHWGRLVSFMQDIPIPGVEGEHTDGTLALLDSIFGLSVASRTDISAEQKQLLHERESARKNQEWTKSDDLRRQLEEQGIAVKDTPNGQVWLRTATN